MCIEGQTSIVDKIRPKLDTKDFYGNLPIHYTIAHDDYLMINDYFTNGRTYFELRNYKYESMFHIAGKKNSVMSIKALVKKIIFQEELLKRDFKGDTPLHCAAKSGSLDILTFYLTACTPNFLLLENDFGLTPLAAVEEKISMTREALQDKDIKPQVKDKKYRKLEKLMAVQEYLTDFEDFITPEKWDTRFEMPYDVFLEMIVDVNLKTFMGFHIKKEN